MKRCCYFVLLTSILTVTACKPAEKPAAEASNDSPSGSTSPADSGNGPAERATSTADSDDNDSAAAAPLAAEGTVTTSVGAASAPVVVQLGTPDLTAGIPGDGPLTSDQIKAWLDDPENHRTISPELPLGLSAAAANIQHVDQNPLTRAKIELGRQLYFDARLSSDGTISCASCHHPDEGFARHTQYGVGVGGQEGGRNSPISYNRIVSGPQFWDGRAASLEEQAGGPIANPIEMGNTHEAAIETIQGIEGYRLQFAQIFPDDGINIDTVTRAIATFERAIVTMPAPYDYDELVRSIEGSYGDEIEELEEEDPELYAEYQTALAGSTGMSESAKRGRELFFSDRAACTACHAGANFSDEKYHNLGVGMEVDNPDLGRFTVTNEESDKGAFKTPTMRNVALSAPYMHDGSQATLEEVVDWYVKGGHPNPHLSDKIKKLDLNDQEEQDLVAFMKEGLTSAFPKVQRERLP